MKQPLNFVEFVTVVETGSFSKAAIKLGVSKSHISKKITQLEHHLGAQLLHRSTRKLVLTDIGEIYHHRCRKIMDDIQITEAIVMEAKSVPSGILNISLPATLGEQILAPMLAEFMQQHPELAINTVITSRLVDILEEGMDLAIRLGHLPDSNMIARKLAQTRWIVFASPSYLEQYGEPQNPDELKNHRCLSFSQHGFKHDMVWQFLSQREKQAFRIQPVFVSNNGVALIEACKKGLGLTYLPEFFVACDLSSRQLCRVLDDCYQDMPISALYPYSHYLSPKVRRCIDFLAESFDARATATIGSGKLEP